MALWVNRADLPLGAVRHEQPPAVAERLQELMDRSDLSEAREFLLSLAGSEPGDPHQTALVMDCLTRLGRHQEAADLGRRALEADPSLHGIALRTGRALLAQERTEEANRVLTAILSDRPEHFRALLELGRVAHHRGELHEAVEWYRKALGVREKSFEVRLLLGSALADGLDLEGAIATFREAVEILPGHLGARTNLGMAYLRKGNRAAARSAFQAVLARDPEEPRALRGLGMLTASEGELGG